MGFLGTTTKVGDTELKDVLVDKISKCNSCKKPGPIAAPRPRVFAPWAWYCETCFQLDKRFKYDRIGNYERTRKQIASAT
jgi:hypothetical protein